MTSKYGFFAEQEYIPPIAHQAIKRGARKEARENALRPFRLVSKDHSGKGKDAIFFQFEYIETADGSRRGAARPKEAAAERVKPFKPASPMKRATAAQAGEISGTISGRYAYILDGGQRRLKKGQIPAQPKNFVIRQPAQGGPGRPGGTISQIKHTTGIAGEYTYHEDPYRPTCRSGKGGAADAASSKPFKAAGNSRSGEAFSRIQYEALASVQKKKTDKPAVKPFRPTFSGRTSGFSPQPAYMASPAIQPSKSQEGKGQGAKHSWRPAHGAVTSATRSIVVMNLR